jgi:hypothetical protein
MVFSIWGLCLWFTSSKQLHANKQPTQTHSIDFREYNIEGIAPIQKQLPILMSLRLGRPTCPYAVRFLRFQRHLLLSSSNVAFSIPIINRRMSSIL